MPTTMHSDEIVDLALRHGFELKRHSTHRIIKRGSFTFTIPSTGNCNAWVTQAVTTICDELDAQARGERLENTTGYPIAVNYAGRLWAVAAQDASRYRLQSLDSGRLTWVPKEDTELADTAAITPATNEDEDIQTTWADESAPQPEPEPEPARPALYDSRGNSAVTTRRLDLVDPALASADPMKYWQLTTERLVRDLNDRLDRLTSEYNAKAEPIRNEIRALETALSAVAGKEIKSFGKAPTATETKPKRPYQTGTVRHFASAETKEAAKQLWLKGAGPTAIYEQLKGDITAKNTVSNWITDWRAEGLTGGVKQ